jgi:murein DD-endopeptidase MepM/ murein hydrolase activator NlpD
VTPTPVIYTVQAGDTLLKIAIEFGLSSEAIQAANGIVDPRFLQIGQTLIIPPAQDSPEDPPTPTPTPLPLNVTAINFQQTRQGTLWCLGAVSNPGDTALTEVVIEASLLDGTGALLAREAAFTQLDVVQPDQTVPFAILFESPPSSFAQYQVMPISAVPLSVETRYYFDLETFDLHGSPEGLNAYRVSGQLRNQGSADAEAVRLVVVAYDQEDRVLAQRQAELAATILKAGATTPFALDLIIPQGVVAHFEVRAQALRVQ